MQLDAPAKVSLFAYDNDTFVVESYLDKPAQVTVTVAGTSQRIRNLATGEVVEGAASAVTSSVGRGRTAPAHTDFRVEIPPHSFVAFEQVGKF